jgi:hypothetical protein
MIDPRLHSVVEEIRRQSEFEAAILTDLDSNILAESKESGTSQETLDVLSQIADQVAGRLSETGMPESGESEFFDWEGRRVVCRWFEAQTPGVLVVLVPKSKSYRWAMNRMVKELQHQIGK